MTLYQYKNEQKMIREQAEFIFKEMSNGIYQCIRSLWKTPEFVGADVVISTMQQNKKVYVLRETGSYCNFEADSSNFMCLNVAIKSEREL